MNKLNSFRFSPKRETIVLIPDKKQWKIDSLREKIWHDKDDISLHVEENILKARRK